MEMTKLSQEDLNKFSGVTDYSFFEDLAKLPPEDHNWYIGKKYRQSKFELIMASYSWFLIYGLFFGALFLGVGILMFNQPISLEEREKTTPIVISIGIALISISFIICTYIMSVSAKLFKYFKEKDFDSLYEAFVSNNTRKNALKKQRSDYAKWAIIYLVNITQNEIENV